MKNKFVRIAVKSLICIVLFLMLVDVACYMYVKITGFRSNRDSGIDTHMTFNVAYIDMGDRVIRVRIDKWRDFGGENQLQVTTRDGYTYLTGSNRMVMVYDPTLDK